MTREPLQLLGGRFHFESNSRELLRLVDSAYAELPRHRLAAVRRAVESDLLLRPAHPAASPQTVRAAAAVNAVRTRFSGRRDGFVELRGPVSPAALGAGGGVAADAQVSLSHPL